jgi:Kdo2-lipid IVA lauroyltransferase/acyltransferase
MGRRNKKRNRFADYAQYLALRLVAMILHCFPVEANLVTAGLLGDFMYAVDKRHRLRAMENLRHSFPDMPEEERRQVARQSMRQLFQFFVEMLFTTRLVRLETWRKYVELADFQKTLELLLDEKRGLIMLTGHYGNWEILGYVLATLGFATTSVARSLDNPFINEYVLGVRQRRGQKIVDKRGATTEVTGILSRGGTVGFIADQNAGSKGIFVDFFGRKASTYKSIALLAMTYEVPVVIGYARRTNHGFRFRVGAQDIILPEDWRDQDDPMRYITQRYTRAIEDFVREEPGQYLWVHRRWKSRPKGEVPLAHD